MCKDVESTSGFKIDQYNSPEFLTDYENAKFFVIKSFSEDNVHKSIKYGIWASTPLGNRKLDAAYHEAKDMIGNCPVFLFFSVCFLSIWVKLTRKSVGFIFLFFSSYARIW